MRRIFIYFLFLFVSLFILVTPSSAQLQHDILNFSSQVPGVGCGIPGDANGADRCCYVETMTCDAIIPGWVIDLVTDNVLGPIPLVGSVFTSARDNCRQTVDNLALYQKEVAKPCISGDPSLPNDLKNEACVCESDQEEVSKTSARLSLMCYNYLQDSKDPAKSKELSAQLNSCLECTTKGEMWTAIGCVPLNFEQFIMKTVFSLGIGLGGLVALLCIIYSAISMQISQGNPEKIKKAQENMTSCITGLILIIFSVFLLRFIGIDILQIPFLE